MVCFRTYQFKISTTMNSNATAEIKFQLQKDYHLPPPEFVNINVGGLRVSRQQIVPEAEIVMKEPLIIMMITDYLADI